MYPRSLYSDVSCLHFYFVGRPSVVVSLVCPACTTIVGVSSLYFSYFVAVYPWWPHLVLTWRLPWHVFQAPFLPVSYIPLLLELTSVPLYSALLLRPSILLASWLVYSNHLKNVFHLSIYQQNCWKNHHADLKLKFTVLAHRVNITGDQTLSMI